MAESKMICPKCGAEMNHHANKVDYDEPSSPEPDFDGVLEEVHTCPKCGHVELREA